MPITDAMRVLVVDHDRARAALVAEGLEGLAPSRVEIVARFDEAVVRRFEPDLVVVACESPDRDTLESLREVSAANPRPIVMFVDRSEPGLAEAAVHAGVAAYVVDGLSAARVRPVLEVALTRFRVMQEMRAELSKAKADLASRRVVEKAKGVLMKERGLDEDAAHRVLRKLAMDKGRSIGATAADLLAYAEVLKAGS